MSPSNPKFPERLRAAEATDFERQLLESAAREQPSPELAQRMALAIGVSASGLTAGAGGAAATTGAQATKAAAASKAFVVWMSAGAVVAAVAVAIVATRLGTSAPAVHPTVAVVSAPLAPPPSSLSAAEDIPLAATNEKSPTATTAATAAMPAPAPRSRVGAQAADLQDQIALVDAARAAVSSGAGGRALEILGQYQNKYPAGSFRPEAAALKIEALAGLGRTAEARALAERFVAEHRGTPLADRVARVAGL